MTEEKCGDKQMCVHELLNMHVYFMGNKSQLTEKGTKILDQIEDRIQVLLEQDARPATVVRMGVVQ